MMVLPLASLGVRPLSTIRVLDTPQNAANAFWRPLVGKPGVIVAIDADGLVTVSIDSGSDRDETGAPKERVYCIPGVDPVRFLVTKLDARPTIVDIVWPRIRLTIGGVAVFGSIGVVFWLCTLLRSCHG